MQEPDSPPSSSSSTSPDSSGSSKPPLLTSSRSSSFSNLFFSFGSGSPKTPRSFSNSPGPPHLFSFPTPPSLPSSPLSKRNRSFIQIEISEEQKKLEKKEMLRNLEIKRRFSDQLSEIRKQCKALQHEKEEIWKKYVEESHEQKEEGIKKIKNLIFEDPSLGNSSAWFENLRDVLVLPIQFPLVYEGTEYCFKCTRVSGEALNENLRQLAEKHEQTFIPICDEAIENEKPSLRAIDELEHLINTFDELKKEIAVFYDGDGKGESQKGFKKIYEDLERNVQSENNFRFLLLTVQSVKKEIDDLFFDKRNGIKEETRVQKKKLPLKRKLSQTLSRSFSFSSPKSLRKNLLNKGGKNDRLFDEFNALEKSIADFQQKISENIDELKNYQRRLKQDHDEILQFDLKKEVRVAKAAQDLEAKRRLKNNLIIPPESKELPQSILENEEKKKIVTDTTTPLTKKSNKETRKKAARLPIKKNKKLDSTGEIFFALSEPFNFASISEVIEPKPTSTTTDDSYKFTQTAEKFYGTQKTFGGIVGRNDDVNDDVIDFKYENCDGNLCEININDFKPVTKDKNDELFRKLKSKEGLLQLSETGYPYHVYQKENHSLQMVVWEEKTYLIDGESKAQHQARLMKTMIDMVFQMIMTKTQLTFFGSNQYMVAAGVLIAEVLREEKGLRRLEIKVNVNGELLSGDTYKTKEEFSDALSVAGKMVNGVKNKSFQDIAEKEFFKKALKLHVDRKVSSAALNDFENSSESVFRQ